MKDDPELEIATRICREGGSDRQLREALKRHRDEQAFIHTACAYYEKSIRDQEDQTTRDIISTQHKRKDTYYKSNYGLTVDQVNEMHNIQGGRCVICHTDIVLRHQHQHHPEQIPTSASAVVDHCHNTGEVRGLLCNKCNTGLGAFVDSIDNLERAIKYLSFYKQKWRRLAAWFTQKSNTTL